jgi:hypothetical protein
MTAGRPRTLSRLQSMPTTENDGQHGQWTREEIEAQDAAFVAAMARAIIAGREHAPVPLAQKNSPGRPGLDQASIAAWV